MVCTGYYKKSDGQYSLIVDYKDSKNIIVYVGSDNTIVSAFKLVNGDKYAYSSKLAESVYETIKLGMSGATSKNGEPVSFKLGGSSLHSFKKKGVSFELQKFNNVPVYLLSDDGSSGICMNYSEETMVHPTLDYVKMNSQKSKTSLDSIGVDEVRVKLLEEVALEKDTSWLNGKKYYIVNDSATAEKLFSQIENYNGILSFDYETTGLKINMFGQYGSKRKQELEEYNEKNPNSKIEVDKVVGFIYSVKENVAYYFPVGHRKFKNLYEDRDETTLKTINNIMARYTVGDFRDLQSDYAKFIRSLSVEEFTPDIILMERNRDILQKKNILAHNGSFEYKVSLLYDIDLNLKEDSMLLHQLMYKFRSIRSSKSEPSNLKYLTKVELGVDQLELVDFFPDFKPDKTGTVRGNKQSSIDFSYMDYDSAKAYAPADGDFTLQIWKKYKKDMQLNFPEMEYIYNVEVIVSMAIGYMEFYGLRIDEVKIEQTRQKYLYDMLMTEYKIRESVGYVQKDEEEVYNTIVSINKELENAEDKEELYEKRDSLCDKLRSLIANSSKAINLNAPAQVSDLLYNKLNYPHPEGELSVKKNVIKGLTKAKNEDGTAKYPVAIYYRDYKDLSSLITKFFGRLQDFMYPSGFFFSSFGQISTATGRMSCLDEDTLVTTVGGVKKIKDVEVGDLVYCYDTDGSVRIKPVLNVIYKGYKECIELKWFSSGNGNTGSLICTPDHRIKTKHNGWVQAKDCLNKKVYHLHRSSEERPRLYGTNSICEQEQLVIRREYFGVDSYDMVIHHIDGNKSNNSIKNLEIQSRSKHTQGHTKKLVSDGKIVFEHLAKSEHRVLSGKEHPNYREYSADDLIDMIVDANGVLSHIDMDFETFKKKCLETGVDCDAVVKLVNSSKRDITKDEFVDAYNRCSGITYKIASTLGISRWRVDTLKKEFGLYNVCSGIDTAEYTTDFYKFNGGVDLLRFKYNLDYRKCLSINKSLGLVYTGVSDADFTESFFRNRGVIRSIQNELGLTWYKVKSTIDRLDLCYNHSVYEITPVGKRNVYDLEIEGIHNFIANELCVHNCSRPNAQQLPKSVTKIIVPRDNYCTIDADFSQIEYRTLTAMAKEEKLIESFRDPDSDYHTTMASLMYQVPYASVAPDMRSSAKSFNFGIPYGMGFKSLSILLFGDASPSHVAKAMELYELYFKDQPNVRKFFDKVKEVAGIYKFNKTRFNRRRYYNFEDAEGNYSEAKKAMALRQAGNFVIQGSAADIFKIAVARNFMFIRDNKLFGKLLITNMVHDEMLFEVDCDTLNIKKVLSEIVKNMEFKIDGFPPLYVGAGVALSWADAKGKMAEIHPVLANTYIAESENDSLYVSSPVSSKSVKEYFDKRVFEFRVNKVSDYVKDESNYNKAIEPAIGNLLGLQFDFGVAKEFAKEYTEDNGYTKEEIANKMRLIPLEQLRRFIDEYNLGVDYKLFGGVDLHEEEEEEEGYDDVDENELEEENDDVGGVFALIDESDVPYGISVQDLIRQFGLVVSKELGICGIDLTKVKKSKKDELISLLESSTCNRTDEGALNLVFLNYNNVLNRTDIYVKDLVTSSVATRLGINAFT